MTDDEIAQTLTDMQTRSKFTRLAMHAFTNTLSVEPEVGRLRAGRVLCRTERSAKAVERQAIRMMTLISLVKVAFPPRILVIRKSKTVVIAHSQK